MNAVEALLRPESIAIVGASERSWQGRGTFLNLQRHGYAGVVHLVNPRYDTLFGRPCHPDVESLPAAVDVAVLAVGAERGVTSLADCARAGVRSAVLFSDGFRESGGEGLARQQRLSALARQGGMAVCGPNSMGIVGARRRAPIWLGELSRLSPDGRIGAVVQSGSVGIALLNNGRGLDFGYLISSGNEAVTTTADYLDVLVDDPDIEIIACHLETVNDAERFLQALERAHRLAKPVVILKTGRSSMARRVIGGHTGSVVGEDLVARALLRQRNAIVVDGLEHLIETLVLLRSPRRPTGRRAGVVTVSGGLSGLCADVSAPLGLRVPEWLVAADGAEPVPNFTDAWGNGAMEQTLAPVLRVAAKATNTDFLAIVHDLEPDPISGSVETVRAIVRAVSEQVPGTDKPIVWISPIPKAFDPLCLSVLTDAGIPVLVGLDSGMAALAQVGGWSERGELDGRSPVSGIPDHEAGGTDYGATEHEGKTWLRERGVPVAGWRLAHSADEAVRCAAQLGYPVVLKNQVAGVEHKTRLGFVRLGVTDDASVRRTVREFDAAARAAELYSVGVLVEEQIGSGLELMLSAFIDESFGRVVRLGPGGVMSEARGAASFGVAPLAVATAERMIDECGFGTLLGMSFSSRSGKVKAELAELIVVVSTAFADGAGSADGAVSGAPSLVEINPVLIPLDDSPIRAADALVRFPAPRP